jgi:hypothetical protein
MLLVDECLSEELAHRARHRGHADATHVRWIGKRGWKDRDLSKIIVRGGYTFVTNNAVDFRGPAESRGSSGEHSRMELHAGLICLNCTIGMDLNMQIELFDIALDEIQNDPDLYNKALEITYGSEADDFVVVRYEIPQGGPYSR